MRKLRLFMSLTCAALLGSACVPQPQRGADNVVRDSIDRQCADKTAAVAPVPRLLPRGPMQWHRRTARAWTITTGLRDDTRQSGDVLNLSQGRERLPRAMLAPTRALQQRLYDS